MYFVGDSCPRGHTLRYLTTKACVECNRDRAKSQRASGYMKGYRSEKADSIKETAKKYREAHREERREAWQNYYKDNAARLSAKIKKSDNWRELLDDVVRKRQQREQQRQRRKEEIAKRKEGGASLESEWQATIRERRAAYRLEYRLKNGDRLRRSNNEYMKLVGNHKRRAKKLAAEGRYSKADIARIRDLQKGKCPRCGAHLSKCKSHIDHIVPLALGGSNYSSNIQILCAPCNLSKGARHPIDDAQLIGRLL